MHWKTGVPTLTHSLRGVASFVVTLRALKRPLHSGYFGGPVPDPVTAMCVLLGSLVDERGVPVIDVTGAPSARSRPGDHGGLRHSATEAEFRAEAGVLPGVKLVGPEHAALADKLWEAATLTVIGMDVPRIRDASNTIQPTCRARISLRLPPDCDPSLAAAALTAHLRHHVPWGLDCELVPVSLQPGWRGNPAGPLSSAAARAFADSYGAPCAFVGLGGTIPFVRPFLDATGHPDCVITGVGDPECAAHGPDESVSVADWRRACLGEALLLGELTEWDMFSATRKAEEADDRKGGR
jgi:acetylornithine deacetylase/succinyl-diaminopimelate desuccinylase-like protein